MVNNIEAEELNNILNIEIFDNSEIKNNNKNIKDVINLNKDKKTDTINKQTLLTKEEKFKLKRIEARKAYRRNKALFYKQMCEEGLFKNKKEKKVFDQELQNKSLSSKCRIIIDLAFNSIMNYKEIQSLASQIGRCYGQNKHRINLFCYHIFGVSDKTVNDIFNKMEAFNWKMFFYNESLDEYLNRNNNVCSNNSDELYEFKDKMIYLSPDSSNILDEFNSNEFFLIMGGIVDKSVKKCLSLNRAISLNVKSCRLPLENLTGLHKNKNVNLNQPLNLDNIVSIIHDYIESNSWNKALELNLVKRIVDKINK